MAKPKVGDSVVHHGHPHEIKALSKRARVGANGDPELVPLVVFENERYRVTGLADELVWSDYDEAWYLPGRILARDERLAYEALTGVYPPPHVHPTARKVLDEALDNIDLDALANVVRKRKGLSGEAAADYAAACLEHCRALKEVRHG